jgi:hypothetical protein
MKTSLMAKLEQLSDKRRAEGTRHELKIILIVTVMAIMSQIYSLRGIETFVKRHKEDLIKHLKIEKKRLPSYSTIRRVLSIIDFNELSEIFKQWVIENDLVNSENWISIDGKSTRSTLSIYSSSEQNFISIVTAFSHNTGIVLVSQSYENKKTSEIPVVENLIKALG